ncbi:UNVERIFIED_CONTAM: hypothetical protein HDU68_008986 [Siphonaria sp. JEL0065]|nr:hypothetical protein HDU68_008983 [Siphonaria sp. JEL0065]KAJ3022686.1 hypothetical protein HDU68_008986 [Siphonaria sp. JEL0065]
MKNGSSIPPRGSSHQQPSQQSHQQHVPPSRAVPAVATPKSRFADDLAAFLDDSGSDDDVTAVVITARGGAGKPGSAVAAVSGRTQPVQKVKEAEEEEEEEEEVEEEEEGEYEEDSEYEEVEVTDDEQ